MRKPIATTNFVLTGWWTVDLLIAWLAPLGMKLVRVERFLAMTFLYLVFVVTELFLRPTGIKYLGLAMAVLVPQVFVAYVGDSRIYLLRDNSFYQLTEDHTVVFEMVRKGILTREQARHHEERNVLSLSMGGHPEITASYWENPMIARDGDRFLLCSDGLHDLVDDSEMQAIVAASPAHMAVPKLIEAARRNGGHDNITAALVNVFVPKVPTEADFEATREFPIPSE